VEAVKTPVASAPLDRATVEAELVQIGDVDDPVTAGSEGQQRHVAVRCVG
jgi:hypothetical protein